MVAPLLIYHGQICVRLKVVRTQTKIPILILKICLMTTFITIMANIGKTGMTVMKKKIFLDDEDEL